jgi:hypothetical protein
MDASLHTNDCPTVKDTWASFVELALRCTKSKQKLRPALAGDILPQLQCMERANRVLVAVPARSPSSAGAESAGAAATSSGAVDPDLLGLFTCPITLAVMTDPVIAADG